MSNQHTDQSAYLRDLAKIEASFAATNLCHPPHADMETERGHQFLTEWNSAALKLTQEFERKMRIARGCA